MLETIKLELFYFWYFSSRIFFQLILYWVIGMVLGSLISVFGKKKLQSIFITLRSKNLGLLGIIPACLIGIASPLCMYGTIPICASFAEKGMEEDWLAAFMVGSILLNPQILLYTAALGPAVLITRFAVCFLGGIIAGLLVHFFCKRRKLFNFSNFSESQNRDTDPNLFIRFLKNLLRNIKATGPAFLIGIGLSALFQRYVSPDAMGDLFGKHKGVGMLIAATIGVPLYFCGGGTIPLLMAWMEDGMSLGSAAAFMIAGPAMKITNLSAMKIILGIRDFALYIAFAILFSIASGFLIDLVF